MKNLYPWEDDERWYSQISPFFCDSGFNFWEPSAKEYFLHVKIEQAIIHFEMKVRKGLIEFLFTGETDTELFSNN